MLRQEMKAILTIAIIVLCHFLLISQKVFQTELGSSLTTDQNGNLIIAQGYINPFENPNFNFLINEDDKVNLDKINRYYQDSDIHFFKKRIFLDKELLLIQSILASAKISKNKSDISKVNLEIKELKKLNKTNEKKYINLKKNFDNFNKVYKLKDRKKIAAKIDSELKKITKPSDSKQINENIKNESLATNKKDTQNKNLVKNDIHEVDIRKPWEILDKYEDNLFVIYTPTTLKTYYKDDQLLKGYANISKKENTHILNLKLVFASNDVMKSYGFIKEGDFLKINFIHGQSMFLIASDNSIGSIEPNTGNTVYNVQFKFKSKADFKRIKRSFVDSIGILWSSGFEYYPVYKIDLLSKQYHMLY